MVNIESLKTKIVDYLASIDMSTLSMQDLSVYVSAVGAANAMLKSDYMEDLLKTISSNGFGAKSEEPAFVGVYGSAGKEAE